MIFVRADIIRAISKCSFLTKRGPNPRSLKAKNDTCDFRWEKKAQKRPSLPNLSWPLGPTCKPIYQKQDGRMVHGCWEMCASQDRRANSHHWRNGGTIRPTIWRAEFKLQTAFPNIPLIQWSLQPSEVGLSPYSSLTNKEPEIQKDLVGSSRSQEWPCVVTWPAVTRPSQDPEPGLLRPELWPALSLITAARECTKSTWERRQGREVKGTSLSAVTYAHEMQKEMATHSSTLAWRVPWMEEPGRL